MPKQTQELNTFTGGFFTEATPLTSPANTCTAIDNFTINKDGSVSKRKGLQLAADLGGTNITMFNKAINKRVGKIAYKAGNTTYTIDMVETPSAPVQINNSSISSDPVAALDGFIWIQGEYVYYHNVLSSSTNFYEIEVRDMWGVDDGLDGPERPSTLTGAHEYNLYNQGWQYKFWVPGPQTASLAGNTKAYGTYGNLSDNGGAGPFYYPGNSDLFSDGLQANNEWNGDQARKAGQYNTEAGKGRFVISPLNRGESRRTVGQAYTEGTNDFLSSIPSDISYQTSPSKAVMAGYAGRMFYWFDIQDADFGDSRSPNLSNFIFFSRVLAKAEDLGKCYSANDPTDPEISDLLPTDGGYIELPELDTVIKMVPISDGLMIVTETQVYVLSGPDGIFRADDYSIELIGEIEAGVKGTNISKSQIITTGDAVWIASPSALYKIYRDSKVGLFTIQNVSVNRFASWWKERSFILVDCHYSPSSKILRIGFRHPGGAGSRSPELVYDMELDAYYIHSYALMTFSGYFPVDTDTYLIADVAGGNRLLTPESDVLTDYVYWSAGDYRQWPYEASLETGYMTFADTQRDKWLPYITTHFNRTEDGFTDVGGGQLEPTNPSSCTLQAKWNFANSASGGKFGTAFQAYRYPRNYMPSGAGDTFDSGESVISTKNRVRGSGKALQLKFTSEERKDCQLLGWGMLIDAGEVV